MKKSKDLENYFTLKNVWIANMCVGVLPIIAAVATKDFSEALGWSLSLAYAIYIYKFNI